MDGASSSDGRKTRSGKEYSCYVVPSHVLFDVTAFREEALSLDEDVTIEACGFIAGAPESADESDEDGARPPGLVLAGPQVGSSAEPLESAEDGDAQAAGKTLAALQRNRDKKRKRREREDKDTGQGAKRRVGFLARATLLKSSQYGVQTGRHSKAGYVGIVDRGLDFAFLDGPAAKRIRRLLRHQYEYLEFDKLPAEYPICDSKGKIFALVLGWPEGWDRRTQAANQAMEKLQRALQGSIPPANRRGPFASYAVGYSFGGGQQEPLPFRRTKREAAAVQAFLDDPDVQAVLKYISGAMATWFPDHVQDYKSCIEAFRSYNKSLTPPSPHIPFPAMTINAGPSTVCLPHRDSPNDAAGVCLDWILGLFDATRGGQLVLHEPRKILALEPGRVILFPSALITHETIPIAAGDWRSGVTGYAPGGLWRYIAQGFATRTAWEATGAKDEMAQHDAKGEQRWRTGIGRFKTLEQLIDCWMAAAASSSSPGHPDPTD